jgi:hypothetical protein
MKPDLRTTFGFFLRVILSFGLGFKTDGTAMLFKVIRGLLPDMINVHINRRENLIFNFFPWGAKKI